MRFSLLCTLAFHFALLLAHPSTRGSANGPTTDRTDETLAALRVTLDKLAEVQRKDAPEDEPNNVSDTSHTAAEVPEEHMDDIEMPREGEEHLAELERKEAEGADGIWNKKLENMDPATPA